MVEAAGALAERLSRKLGKPVRLQVTDNRSTMLSFKPLDAAMGMRLHHMFLEAPEPVVAAIADYATRGSARASELLDRFVRENTSAIRPSRGPRGPSPLRPEGRVHSLRPLFDRLNLAHFDGRIEAEIGWGRAGPRSKPRRRRSIRMGTYDPISRMIRIHPALDSALVPEFFVEYVVFHEMLHQAIPGKTGAGRTRHHTREFVARERAYPDYARAITWEKANLSLLLDAAKRLSAHAHP